MGELAAAARYTVAAEGARARAVAMASSSRALAQLPERITLNVGGQRFDTTQSTLCRFDDTFFTAMLSGRHAVLREPDGSIFIDRDPTHFRAIINFMRDGTLRLPKGAEEKAALVAELRFYNLEQHAAGALTPELTRVEVVELLRASCTNFASTDLSGLDLSRLCLQRCAFSWCSLAGAQLAFANLAEADLSHVDLRGASLRGANLRGASLAGANMCGADLRDTSLHGAIFSIDAELAGANVEGAHLASAIVGDRSCFFYAIPPLTSDEPAPPRVMHDVTFFALRGARGNLRPRPKLPRTSGLLMT